MDNKLHKKIDELVLNKKVVDHEVQIRDEEFVLVWTLEKTPQGTVIVCNYLDYVGGKWFVESIDESKGPSVLTCPLRFLEADVPDDFVFLSWRKEVMKYHMGRCSWYQDDETFERLGEERYKEKN